MVLHSDILSLASNVVGEEEEGVEEDGVGWVEKLIDGLVAHRMRQVMHLQLRGRLAMDLGGELGMLHRRAAAGAPVGRAAGTGRIKRCVAPMKHR